MNVAYYVLAFDQGVDLLWTRFGLTDEYIEEHESSTFAVESHVTWQREIAEAELVAIHVAIGAPLAFALEDHSHSDVHEISLAWGRTDALA